MIEPLSPTLWFQRLEWIRTKLANAPIEGSNPIEPLLRHAYHLTQLAPGPFSEIAKATVKEEDFEALLDGENFLTAVSKLFNIHVELSLSEKEGAKVALASSHIFSVSVVQIAETKPRAALAAWVDCLFAIKEASLEKSILKTMHLGQHRSPIESLRQMN